MNGGEEVNNRTEVESRGEGHRRRGGHSYTSDMEGEQKQRHTGSAAPVCVAAFSYLSTVCYRVLPGGTCGDIRC